MSLATLTKTGRAALALAVSKRPLHLAWGTGSPEWDEETAELPILVNATALAAEVGRRAPAFVGFVEPDEAGDIVIPMGTRTSGAAETEEDVEVARYRQVDTPTPYLYIRANYDYQDAASSVIREMAVFMDTVTKPELPPGQRYFFPADLVSPGLLMAVQVFNPPINRSPSVRQSVEFVLTI